MRVFRVEVDRARNRGETCSFDVPALCICSRFLLVGQLSVVSRHTHKMH